MGLKKYWQKRDFSRTPEPSGKEDASATGGDLFIVQKHAASRLHYDFRLELDGVLLSWAVPKGPSLDPKERRLAVHVEDHPLAYGDFEGVIPKGQYGGGTVMLWDRGSWQPDGDPRAMLERGDLKFRLDGERLEGSWKLVRMTGRASEDGKNWLLIKGRDDVAREDRPITEEMTTSVASGRTMEEIASDRDRVWTSGGETKGTARRERKRPTNEPAAASDDEESDGDPGLLELSRLEGAAAAELPARLAPQLATLASEVPQGEAWLHEIKLDGYRVVGRIESGEARLLTRNGKDWTAKFGDLAPALAALPVDSAWVDGEIVVLDDSGVSDFQKLQGALSGEAPARLHYYLFDLPYLDGYDLRRVQLVERKRRLARLLRGVSDPLRYSDHVTGRGAEVLLRACDLTLEGIISKRAASRYESRRSRSWLKLKCTRRQELVIGGYSEPSGSRQGFGALLVGWYEGERLIYAGRVGTGFDGATLERLAARLEALEIDDCPFDPPPSRSERKGAHWVRPELVAEVAFTGWTDSGRLRHPSFQGLREDKAPSEVVRERPAPPTKAKTKTTATKKTATAKSKATESKATQSKATQSKATRSKARKATPGRGSKMSATTQVAGIRLTSPDRVVYPDQGVTKLDLARYYESVAEHILPFVAGRPLSVVRCPQGRGSQCFYQKHLTDSLPEAVGGVEIEESDGKATYIVVHDLPGIVALVQMGTLELHPWGSREDRLERPDVLVFDLDPAPGVGWPEVKDGALFVRELLAELELESFLRTSGGKGLHVVVPIDRRSSWDEAKGFARAVAEEGVRREPGRYIATASKAKRKGKIFLDYLRNGRGATAIASYSTRARAGAPVATPLAWSELESLESAAAFGVTTVPERLAELDRDPWEGFFTVRQSLTKKRLAALGAGG